MSNVVPGPGSGVTTEIQGQVLCQRVLKVSGVYIDYVQTHYRQDFFPKDFFSKEKCACDLAPFRHIVEEHDEEFQGGQEEVMEAFNKDASCMGPPSLRVNERSKMLLVLNVRNEVLPPSEPEKGLGFTV